MFSRTTNGRVNIIQPDTNALFKLYDRIPAKQMATFRHPTVGIFDQTELISLFFSPGNISRLQHGIQQGVFDMSKSKFRIGIQDEDTLFIIMRSIYLQYSKNQPIGIDQQVKDLNSRVLKYCVTQVYSEALGYVQYLSDASTMYTPMDHPIMPSPEDKHLEFSGWF